MREAVDISRFIPVEVADTVVVRTDDSGGWLREPPLLLKACGAGVFGTHVEYDGGAVDQSLFTYLSGRPSDEFFRRHPSLFFGVFLVCMTPEWTEFIRDLTNPKLCMTRWMMSPEAEFILPDVRLPEAGYVLSSFDERAFAEHPFDHGANYTWESFSRDGAGAVIRQDDTIVASASSFLSWRNHVELDVSTLPEHRGRGLASACVSHMLADCQARGLTVHWDAQNIPSRKLAEKFGFRVEQEYAVTKMLQA